MCIEKDRDYGDDVFEEYSHYPMHDHNVPVFGDIYKFCLDVEKYMKKDSNNVIAVHCKAGKSRTG